MSDYCFYRFFQGDYLSKTTDLTLVEHGVYHLFLHYYYSHEHLPADKERLYRIAGAHTPEERLAVDTIVARYFKLNGNGNLVNQKCEEEIAYRSAKAESQKKKAQAGAAARWCKKLRPEGPPNQPPQEMPRALPKAVPQGVPGDYQPYPYPDPDENKKKKTHTGEKFQLPEWMPEETWSVFLAHRKAVKAPVTEKAYPTFIEKFFRLKSKGWPPKEVVDVMIEKGWRWFKPEWLNKGDLKGLSEKTKRTVENLKDWLDEEEGHEK